jgi:hypothetical protein
MALEKVGEIRGFIGVNNRLTSVLWLIVCLVALVLVAVIIKMRRKL